MEGFLDFVKLDRFGDELVERQTALQVQVDEHREVTRWEAVAVPGRLQRSAPTEDLDQRQLDLHGRIRHAHQNDRASQITSVEGLFIGLRQSDGLNTHIGAVAFGELTHPRHRVFALRVDGVRRAEVFRPVELLVVDVDGDDRAGASKASAGDGCVADATAAENRD